MKILNKFLIGFICLAAFSCKDFLTVKPSHMLPLEGSIETVEDCRNFRTGLYQAFKDGGGLAGSAVIASDIQCDFVLPVINNQQAFAFSSNWTFNSQNFEGSASWTSFYKTISRANFLLQNIPPVRASIKKTVADSLATEADRKQYLIDSAELSNIAAECYMARALCRVELVKLFADAYEPSKATQTLALPIWNNVELGTPSRVKMDVYYDSVLMDISRAQAISTMGADNVYFTKAAVNMLEARVHLYMENWPAAIIAATKVIDESGCTLLDAVPIPGQEVRETPYAKMWSKDIGNEIIWKIGYLNSDESVSSFGSIFCALSGNNEFTPQFVMVNKFVSQYDPRDQRIGIFFDLDRQTDYTHGLVAHALVKFPGNSDLNKAATTPRYGNMPKVMRLAEAYLIRAEAYARSGQEGPANTDLSALRMKRLSNYTAETFSGTALMTQIKNERKFELVLEGHRLYDLKRFKEGFTREKQNQTQDVASRVSVTSDNPRFTWPIPSFEFDVPGSIMEKNPSNDL